MTRITTIITFCLLTALSTGGAHASEIRRPSGPCDGHASIVKPAMGHDEVAKRVQQLIRCAAGRFNISAPRMLCTAYRESRYWPWADSGSSKGVMQQNATYWLGRVHAYWTRRWMPHHYPPNIFTARANVLVSARMIAATGWGDWSGGCL